MGAVTASAFAGPEHAPEFAFDKDPRTSWFVPPSAAAAATLTIRPEPRATLEAIELESRETALWESWHTVRVVLHRNGRAMVERTFTFDDADRVPTHTIALDAPGTDLVELHFANPVTRTKGGQPVEAGLVSPGYREIRLKWADE